MPDESVLDRFIGLLPQIRRRFPQINRDALGNPRIHLNCAAGTLVVDSAAEVMAGAAARMNSLPGDVYPGEIATKEFQGGVRATVAEFLNAADPAEISFHFSSSNALFNLAFALGRFLNRRRNIVVTDLDHMANVSPWEDIGATGKGCAVNRARILPSGLLDPDHLLSLINEETTLVAVTMASNGLGSLVPLQELIAAIKFKSPSCLVCVDAVHQAPHGPIDVQALDCDFLTFSGYKVFGPMLGVLWGKKSLLEKLVPYRVETNKNEPPYKFEQGTLSNATLASLEAALGYLLWLADEINPAFTSVAARIKFKAVMTAIAAYEAEMSRRVLTGFQNFDSAKFLCYGITDPQRCRHRAPTFAFEIAGRSAREIKKYLWEQKGIQVADGNHYSAVFYRHFKRESVCRASLAHYNAFADVDTFLAALEEILSS
jgi:cysteine desulfurase family protein (TIGR01976 family)